MLGGPVWRSMLSNSRAPMVDDVESHFGALSDTKLVSSLTLGHWVIYLDVESQGSSVGRPVNSLDFHLLLFFMDGRYIDTLRFVWWYISNIMMVYGWGYVCIEV